MRGDELVDRPVDPDPTVGDEHQMVGDPLELGEQVRGQHHRDAVVGHRRHHRGHEVVPGQRIERRGRLVEHQQPRVPGQGEAERQLGLLSTGQLPGLVLAADAQIGQPLGGQGGSKLTLRLRVRCTMSPTDRWR